MWAVYDERTLHVHGRAYTKPAAKTLLESWQKWERRRARLPRSVPSLGWTSSIGLIKEDQLKTLRVLKQYK